MTPRVAAILVMLIFAGCTTSPDWIDRTLVTVDVTGQWQGTTLARAGASAMAPEMLLDLEQKGPRATGAMRSKGLNFGSGGWVPIEGTVAGDVFTFRQRNGSGQGRLTVTGDEMSGDVVMGDSFPMRLRRIESAPGPNSKQP